MLGEWPLDVTAPSSSAGEGNTPAFDPTATWTLVAAGDVMNDREVYRHAVLLGAGPDYPWDGGTARIAGGRAVEGVSPPSRRNGPVIRAPFENCSPKRTSRS